MVQAFMVIRCYSCKTFQVHQVKKSNKWVCKLCEEKQSVKRVFSEGTGAECRMHVQQLNLMRGEMDQELGQQAACKEDNDSQEQLGNVGQLPNNTEHRSRWKRFMSDEQVNEDEDELDCEGMMVTTIRKGTNSLEQRKKRKREKALVDAKLLYPPRKQTRFQEADGNELRWSSTTTCNTKHDSAPGLHQTATVSRRYNDILTLTPSSFPSNCDKQNYITKPTNKNISLTHLKSSDRWDKTTESSNQKRKYEKPSASSTVDVVQQNRQQVLKQHNQVDKINSKWEKFMVQDDPSIDEPETNSCESKKAEKENAIVGCSPFNDYQGCAMSCKDRSSSAMETIQRQSNRQQGSNSKHEIPGKSSLLQSKVAVDSPCKPTYDGIFQLDDEELEGNWWAV